MKPLGNRCSTFNLCFRYGCCIVSDKHSLMWQKMTWFSTKYLCIIICSAQTHASRRGKIIKMLQNVAQLPYCALAHVLEILFVCFFFTARAIFSSAKHGFFIVPQPTWTPGQTISKDDLVSGSFIPNSRSENIAVHVWYAPRSIQEAKGTRSHSVRHPSGTPVGGLSSENGGSPHFLWWGHKGLKRRDQNGYSRKMGLYGSSPMKSDSISLWWPSLIQKP